MKIFLLFFLAINIYALDIKKSMLSLYQNQNYEEVCKVGFTNFENFSQDEEFVSLYAFGCLYADYIDRLTVPITMLKYSQEARANSAYFSIILMQKKLLYHAMMDGYDISTLNMPTTDYILSKVFDQYVKLGKHEVQSAYIFTDENDARITYKLYLLKDVKIAKMVIEKFYAGESVKRHVYW